MTNEDRLLRVFEVRTKPGCTDQLLQNFSTTSAGVVEGQPGNNGYFFGKCTQGGVNVILFVSVWQNLDAIKQRFGDDWRSSYLPDGYEDLIEECSIRHFDVGSGWHVKGI